jgi:protein involved in polysaccharide export with SLBB domain
MKTRVPLSTLAAVAAMLAVSGAATDAQNPSMPPTSPPQPPVASVPQQPDATPVSVDPMALWTSGRYRITPSDVLELQFPYVPEFNQTVTVQPDGYISLTGAGDIRVQGWTLPEAKALLAEAYQSIMRDPVVNIVLKEFEKPYFIVSGEVSKPGKYELRGATTLTQGMALAGGHTEAAKTSHVLLLRGFMTPDWLEVKQIDVKKMFTSHDLSEDPLLRPGDTVFVPKSTFSKIAPFIPNFGWGIYFNPF